MRSVSQDDLFNVLRIFTGKNQPSFNSPELHRQNLSLQNRFGFPFIDIPLFRVIRCVKGLKMSAEA